MCWGTGMRVTHKDATAQEDGAHGDEANLARREAGLDFRVRCLRHLSFGMTTTVDDVTLAPTQQNQYMMHIVSVRAPLS